LEKYDVLSDFLLYQFCIVLLEKYFNRKKLKHYPSVWQAAPFSMETFIYFEEEARIRNKEVQVEKKKTKKEKKSRFRFAFGLW
jgi:hypothetical protein